MNSSGSFGSLHRLRRDVPRWFEGGTRNPPKRFPFGVWYLPQTEGSLVVRHSRRFPRDTLLRCPYLLPSRLCRYESFGSRQVDGV